MTTDLRPSDWLILVCTSMGLSGDGFDSDSEPEDEDDLPYWIMAFPMGQVTDSTAEPFVPDATGSPSVQVKGVGILMRTTLALGYAGHVPLLHGRDSDERFADEFMKACMEGKGVVELFSEDALPLQRL